MNKIKIVFLSLFTFFYAFCARADLPEYDRGEMFSHCLLITQDWSICLKENADRVLKKIQQNYRTILHKPKLLSWNNTVEQNTLIMKDMYESWTAYRNRWCSLSVVATKYNAPLFDPQLSCMDYQNMRANDYLQNIINLIDKKVSPQRSKLDFMKITEHDTKFKSCISKATEKSEIKTVDGTRVLPKNSPAYQTCLKDEVQRTNSGIKQYYADFLADEFIGKWNNGPSLKSGNYRDMFDSWVSYRNRLCSLITWAFQNTYGAEEYSLSECILHLNQEKMEASGLLLQTTHTFLDDEAIYTDEDGNETEVDVTEGDDGGAAEGAKIKPLSRHIHTDIDEQEGAVSMDKSTNENTSKNDSATDKKKKLPAWAQ